MLRFVVLCAPAFAATIADTAASPARRFFVVKKVGQPSSDNSLFTSPIFILHNDDGKHRQTSG